MIYLGALRKTKDIIITGLRAFFANPKNYAHLLPEQLPADVFLEMTIFDSFPQDLLHFPMIVISSSGGRMISGGISNSFATETYDDNGNLEGYLYGGMYEFNIEVEVGTKTTLEREVLMDFTTSALKFSLRRRMEYHGIIVKEISYGGENQLPYNSDMIYTSTMNMQTYSEWHDYYRLLPVTSIDGQTNYTNSKKKQSGFHISLNDDIKETDQ